MGLSGEDVRVVILGDEYSIRGDVDSETTRKVAEYVGQKMAQTQSGAITHDKLKVAVLSAMNITGEYFDFKNRCEESAKQLDEWQRRAEMISKRIDTVLGLQC